VRSNFPALSCSTCLCIELLGRCSSHCDVNHRAAQRSGNRLVHTVSCAQCLQMLRLITRGRCTTATLPNKKCTVFDTGTLKIQPSSSLARLPTRVACSRLARVRSASRNPSAAQLLLLVVTVAERKKRSHQREVCASGLSFHWPATAAKNAAS